MSVNNFDKTVIRETIYNFYTDKGELVNSLLFNLYYQSQKRKSILKEVCGLYGTLLKTWFKW